MRPTSDVFDVITMGRISIDMYPTDAGSLVDARRFEKFLGGSPTNVAVAASRLGDRSAVISRTGSDPFGEFIHTALHHYGVDDRYVTAVPRSQTPVAFCEIFPPDNFPLYFYRTTKAPDLDIEPSELDVNAIQSARLFWVTVSGLSMNPSRSATMAALEARNHQFTVLDLDYRSSLWPSLLEARSATRAALVHATVAIGNLSEVEMAVDTRDPDIAANRLLEHGLDLAIVKLGPEGVMAKTRNERVEIPPIHVEVVNGLGAGDAFGGAFCHGALAGWPLRRTLQFANAAGAIVSSRLSCSDAMPTVGEIEALIGRMPHE